MNPPLVTAVRGPILMITLGLLFVADRYGAAGFGQTWPVLIIAYGILKLLERLALRRRELGAGGT